MNWFFLESFRKSWNWVLRVKKIGELIYEEFLNKNGDGTHHIAFTVEDLDAETAGLAEKGVPVVLSGKLSTGHQFRYFDTGKVGGTIIELIEPPRKRD